MEIRTANCKLRSFKLDDADEYFEIVNDEAIEKYVKYAYCKNIIQAKRAVRDYIHGDCKNDFYLVIEKDDIIVGSIIAVKIKEATLDVSVCIGKEFRGQGIMKEAIEGFMFWLKENTEYLNLCMSVNIDNESSLRLIDKLNAKPYKHKNDYNYYRVCLK